MSEPFPGVECKGSIAAPLPPLHTDRFVASHPCWQALDHNCHKLIHWQGGLCSEKGAVRKHVSFTKCY